MIVTFGNQPGNEDYASIFDLSAGGDLVHDADMDEQGNMCPSLYMSSGETILCGTDPALGDDWTLGNIYVKKDGTWAKKRTLPNVIHTFGSCEHNGKLYVGTGAHTGDNATWQGRVFWSEDVGDTWQGSSEVAYYRIMDVASFVGKLYAISNEVSTQKLYVSEDSGVSWSVIPNTRPHWRQRFFKWNGLLCLIEYARMNIVSIDPDGVVETINLPEIFGPSVFNGVAVHEDNIYTLCAADQSRVWKYDGEQWTYHCNLGETCCSLLNFEDQFLVTSTMGVDAKILKIPL